MLTFSSVLIGSEQSGVLTDFYQKVFGKSADWTVDGWSGFQVGSMYIIIGEHSEVKGKAREPQRAIVNFETEEVKKEFERIKGLGAKVVKELYQMEDAWIATFADPDGNYFQVMSPWKMGK